MAKSNEIIAGNVATGSILYRVNYQYVAKSGQLRGGTVVVDAPNVSEANEKALGLVKDFGLQNYRITSTKPF